MNGLFSAVLGIVKVVGFLAGGVLLAAALFVLYLYLVKPERFLRPGKGRQIRAAKGITAYVGPNGGGKTACMVWDTLPTLARGLPVLSTVRLLDYTDPRPCEDPACHIVFHADRQPPGDAQPARPYSVQWWPQPCDKTDPLRHKQAHPLWVPLVEWRQLFEFRDGDILLDEVTGIAGARDHHHMPSEVGTHLRQLRKGDTVTRWTAPTWGAADTVIRGCTQLVVTCSGLMAKEHVAGPGERPRRWRQNRWFKWTSYDAEQFEEFDNDKRDKLKRFNTDRHMGPGSIAFLAYATYEKSLTIGSVNQFGKCMDCGGTRRAPACSCPKSSVDHARITRLPDADVLDGAGTPLAGCAGECSASGDACTCGAVQDSTDPVRVLVASASVGESGGAS